MKEGDRVRVIIGDHKGKTRKVLRPITISQVQDLAPGQDISMEGAKTLWAIHLDEGNEQTVLEEKELELMTS